MPGTVEFCCPDCDKAYYGTGPTGHLVPSAFRCVDCGRDLQMDDMVLRPAAGVDEAAVETGGVPWTQRKKVGRWRGFTRTIGMSMTRPGELIRGAPRADEGGTYWAFAAWALFVTFLATLGVMALFQGLMVLAFSGQGGIGTTISILFGFGVAIAAGVLASLLFILLWGLTVQGVLRLTRGEHQPIRFTYRALCYSAGANVASAVPCVGWYLGWIWWVISAVIMVKQTHRISGGRAALAALALPSVCVLAVIGLYAALVVWGLSMFNSGAYLAPGAETQRMLDASLYYAQAHGALPDHPLRLVEDGRVWPHEFTSFHTDTYVMHIAWPGLKLADLEVMDATAQGVAIRSWAAGLRPDAVAHRAGDFVFTCPGVDPGTLAPDVWLVIFSPMPEIAQSSAPAVCVGLADGNFREIPRSAYAAEFAAQTALRAAGNLPPLPDPTQIAHAAPPVASRSPVTTTNPAVAPGGP